MYWGSSVVWTGWEQWDDGNLISGDGWDHEWKIESGWLCSGEPSVFILLTNRYYRFESDSKNLLYNL